MTAPASKQYPRGDQPVSERRRLVCLKRVLRRLGLPGHLHTFRPHVSACIDFERADPGDSGGGRAAVGRPRRQGGDQAIHAHRGRGVA